MTNEEKAREIAKIHKTEFYVDDISPDEDKISSYEECFYTALHMAEWKDEQIISLLPQIITCVYQGFTQCASDEIIIKELTNLINQTENYEPHE